MILEAYGDSAISYSQVFRLLKLFKNGQEEMKNGLRSGWPSTSKNKKNMSRVSDLLKTNRQMSVRMMADTLNIPKQSINSTHYMEVLNRLRKRVVRYGNKIATTWQLASRQRSQPHLSACRGVPGQTQFANVASASLQY